MRIFPNKLGRRAGIRQSDVSAIERGRLNPTEEELRRLANALDFSPPSALMKRTVIERSEEQEANIQREADARV